MEGYLSAIVGFSHMFRIYRVSRGGVSIFLGSVVGTAWGQKVHVNIMAYSPPNLSNALFCLIVEKLAPFLSHTVEFSENWSSKGDHV